MNHNGDRIPDPRPVDRPGPSAWSFVSVSVRGRGKGRTKCCQNSRGTETRGVKRSTSERGRGAGGERVKRKVGRNTHSLTPLLFLSLSRGKSNKSAWKSEKRSRRHWTGRTTGGRNNTTTKVDDATRRFPPSNPDDDRPPDRPRPPLPPAPLEPICLTLFQHLPSRPRPPAFLPSARESRVL